VLKDDLTPVLASLENADILVMGTPITGEDPTAYFKIFFERFYSFLKHDGSCRLPAGKKVVLVLSPGAAEGEFEKAVESFITWLQPFGFSELHWIICPQGGKNDAYEAIETVIGKLIGGPAASSGQPA
jgi:multimeric flavodoxin WrbA